MVWHEGAIALGIATWEGYCCNSNYGQTMLIKIFLGISNGNHFENPTGKPPVTDRNWMTRMEAGQHRKSDQYPNHNFAL